MIWLRQLRAEAFGCIQDATLPLTRLHAIVGPNDSGKSTLLRAIEAVWWYVADGLGRMPEQTWTYARAGSLLTGTFDDGLSLKVHLDEEMAAVEGTAGTLGDGTRPKFVQFSPDRLRQFSPPWSSRQPLDLGRLQGRGLGALYGALVERNVDGYLEVRESVRELFPTVADVKVLTDDHAHKGIEIRLADGQVVPASGISEGILYYLAYAALPHLDGDGPYLVEEPENGLHPARVGDVVRILRKLSESNQVVLATHSPLVINELQPDEVSIVTRPATGTRVTRMVDTPDFDKRSSVYSLGELWLAYADGDQEAALVPGASVG